MIETANELIELADKLDGAVKQVDRDVLIKPLKKIETAAAAVGKSFSGSWLGYHASVYYAEFKIPPPGAVFSQEWGLMRTVGSLGSRGNWIEYSEEDVSKEIRHRAGNPKIEPAQKACAELEKKFDDYKSEILSIISSVLIGKNDTYLGEIKKTIEELDHLTPHEVAERLKPSGQVLTRDTNAAGQKFRKPPHIGMLSQCYAIENSIHVAEKMSKLARQAGSHVLRLLKNDKRLAIVGTNVFIGHGRSPLWRDLKDFVQDRLKLPWDEFNRVPVAGITNIQRLSQMLDAAAIAFLIMTAEDDHDDGKTHARQNVVHEAGLFQGRLGFTRAIVLLEDGCAEFSNIHGLGQIRFPKGNIKAAFEEIRAVLEREGIIEPT